MWVKLWKTKTKLKFSFAFLLKKELILCSPATAFKHFTASDI